MIVKMREFCLMKYLQICFRVKLIKAIILNTFLSLQNVFNQNSSNEFLICNNWLSYLVVGVAVF